MRKFSVRPTLTMRGRTFKGLRGWSGERSLTDNSKEKADHAIDVVKEKIQHH